MAEFRQIITVLGMISLLFIGIPIRVDKAKEYKNVEKIFLNYVQKYNKSYRYSPSEYEKRYEAFRKSMALIDELNKNRTLNSSALYGLTQYSDLEFQEFHHKHLRARNPQKLFLRKNHTHRFRVQGNRVPRAVIEIPAKLDWRTQHVVTDVYNQKLCGACWAFSTVETIESMSAIKTGLLQKLSVQEMIDCSRNYNEGCEGGDICSLLSWLYDNKISVEPEKAYPLKLATGACQMKNLVSDNAVSISDYSCDTFTTDEKAIIKILATHGPVAVAVNALTWQNYLGGVIQYHCDGALTSLNHAVQLVGYDLTAEIPYYLARNSWGTSFGEGGYIKLAIGSNICGLANEVARIFV